MLAVWEEHVFTRLVKQPKKDQKRRDELEHEAQIKLKQNTTFLSKSSWTSMG
jgi:hypothetical protein